MVLKIRNVRPRNLYYILSWVVIIGLLLLSDPDSGIIQNLPIGASTIAILMSVLVATLVVSILSASRHMLLDYDIAEFSSLLKKACETPQGAGLASVAVAIMTLSIAIALVGGLFILK